MFFFCLLKDTFFIDVRFTYFDFEKTDCIIKYYITVATKSPIKWKLYFIFLEVYKLITKTIVCMLLIIT